MLVIYFYKTVIKEKGDGGGIVPPGHKLQINKITDHKIINILKIFFF